MGGGRTNTNQDYNPNMYFAPEASTGGQVNIGGNVSMGSAEFGGSSTASGASTSFSATGNFNFDAPKMPGTLMLMNLNQLQNLVNEIDIANIQATANFKGDGKGSNHVKTLNGQAGSVLNFSQLQNLADSHMGNFDSYGFVEFQGGGAGMHTIDNMRGNAGSHTVFSI